MNARVLALRALRIWHSLRRHADEIFHKLADPAKNSAQDRAFALELFYGVLRNLTLLDFWIGQLRSGRVDVDLRNILRLGLYQLLIANVPEHAAVNETVGLASQRARAVANAILRNAIRRKEELLGLAQNQPLALRTSHPDFLVARWQNQFGEAPSEHLCLWNNQPPTIYVRVNQLKIDIDTFRQKYPAAQETSVRNFFATPASLSSTALEAGACYVQDPSTRLACELLDPKPDERVLDACAAPGGKTAYLAELMHGTGAILAVDRQPARLNLLEQNLGRLGVTIVKPLGHDWRRGPITSHEKFDRILIDAPCSNTGVLRRRVDARWRLRPNEFTQMAKEQLSILRAVAPLLKEGGTLVYSTCSLEREENEDVVQTFVKEMSIFQRQTEHQSLPFRDSFDGAYVAKLAKTT